LTDLYRWLFLLEGLPAVLVSFVALFWLPDYPENSRMLTEEERAFFSSRLDKTRPHGKALNWDTQALKRLFSDPTVYTFCLYWIAHGIGGFGINFALPTVVFQLGFTTTSKSQLMNIVSLPGTRAARSRADLCESHHTCHASSSSTLSVSCSIDDGSVLGRQPSQVSSIPIKNASLDTY
jgi:hypothetical protein